MIEFKADDGGRADAGYKGITRDCACRSIAIATETPYDEVYEIILEYAKKERRFKKSHPRTGVWQNTFRKIMTKHFGWVWVPKMHIGSGCTTHLRKDELPPGRIICNVSKHYTAVVDGILHDTHDCSREGTRCVYGYFIKE